VEVSTLNYLLIRNVPYVTSKAEVAYGTLASELSLDGTRTTRPGTHVALFAGEYPCFKDGSPMEALRHQSINQEVAPDVVA
jgi:hypothetical protein